MFEYQLIKKGSRSKASKILKVVQTEIFKSLVKPYCINSLFQHVLYQNRVYVSLRVFRKSGRSYYIPTYVSKIRSLRLGITQLIKLAPKQFAPTFETKLSLEFLAILGGTSLSYEQRVQTLKTAVSGIPFLKYLRRR